jgi:hypothetical protein
MHRHNPGNPGNHWNHWNLCRGQSARRSLPEGLHPKRVRPGWRSRQRKFGPRPASLRRFPSFNHRPPRFPGTAPLPLGRSRGASTRYRPAGSQAVSGTGFQPPTAGPWKSCTPGCGTTRRGRILPMPRFHSPEGPRSAVRSNWIRTSGTGSGTGTRPIPTMRGWCSTSSCAGATPSSLRAPRATGWSRRSGWKSVWIHRDQRHRDQRHRDQRHRNQCRRGSRFARPQIWRRGSIKGSIKGSIWSPFLRRFRAGACCR